MWPFKKKKISEQVGFMEDNQESSGDPLEEAGLSASRQKGAAEDEKSFQNNLEDMTLESLKHEYGKVTSYLKDIQLIDMAPEEDRQLVTDIARGIYDLFKERNRLQKQKYKITDRQKNALEAHEDTIEKDRDSLKKEEAFLADVKSDLSRLNMEKKSLQRKQKDTVAKQKTLRTLAKSMMIILAALILFLFTLERLYDIDITKPFLGVIAFGLLICSFILYEVYRNRRFTAITNKKRERAVLLINRTKIKYVNSVKLIDYLCGKYDVRNSMELEYVCDQYKQMKKEMAMQYESTRLLEEYHDALIREMEKLGVKDCEIWYFQAEALADPREMVEVRHHLNEKRQRIRFFIDKKAKMS